MRQVVVVAAVAGLSVGCAGGDGGGGSSDAGAELLGALTAVAVDSTADVAGFSGGSAPNAFFFSYLPIFNADLALQLGGTCPTVTESGSSTVYEGGCSSNGTTWTGTATVRASSGGQDIQYEAFGSMTITSCGGAGYETEIVWTGHLDLGGTPSSSTFDSDVRADLDGIDEDDCSASVGSVGIDYRGSFSEVDEDTMIFDGSGAFGFDLVSGGGAGYVEGRVDAGTTDEVVVTTITSDTSGALCQTEALSGTTTFEGDGHTTVITYDGATDCDAASTVTWTLDGADQGEVSGVSCSVTRVDGRGFPAAILLGAALALGALGARRRTRRT